MELTREKLEGKEKINQLELKTEIKENNMYQINNSMQSIRGLFVKFKEYTKHQIKRLYKDREIYCEKIDTLKKYCKKISDNIAEERKEFKTKEHELLIDIEKYKFVFNKEKDDLIKQQQTERNELIFYHKKKFDSYKTQQQEKEEKSNTALSLMQLELEKLAFNKIEGINTIEKRSNMEVNEIIHKQKEHLPPKRNEEKRRYEFQLEIIQHKRNNYEIELQDKRKQLKISNNTIRQILCKEMEQSNNKLIREKICRLENSETIKKINVETNEKISEYIDEIRKKQYIMTILEEKVR